MTGPSPTVRRRTLGVELRRLREQARMTIGQVATALEVSDSKISRIETAQVRATPRDVRDMLDLYGISNDHRDWLIQVAREARQKGWWEDFGDLFGSHLAGLEAGASSMRTFAALSIPGLLQTINYARAVHVGFRPDLAPDDIERRIRLRMRRRAVLDQEDAPTLWSVIDEGALRRMIGGQAVMQEQLLHLVDSLNRPNVTIQILPFITREYPGLAGGFHIIDFPGASHPDIVHIENGKNILFLERDEDIEYYSMVFGRLRAVALTPSDSRAFLISTAEALS